MGMYETGMTLTANEASNYLRKQKLYSNAYSQINDSLRQQSGTLASSHYDALQGLKNDYASNKFSVNADFDSGMREIINNAAQSRMNLLSASSATGDVNRAMSDLERAVTSAYDNRVLKNMSDQIALNRELIANQASLGASLSENVGKLQDTASEAISAIDKKIEYEAKNYELLYNTPWEYLMYLDSKGLINREDENFGRFYNTTYVNGKPVGSLIGDKERDSLFYTNGQLNDVGKDFYEQVLYGSSDMISADGNRIPSYSEWLKGNNEELYNWANSSAVNSDYGSRNFENVFGASGLGEEVKRANYAKENVKDTVKTAYKVGTEGEKIEADIGNIVRYVGTNGTAITALPSSYGDTDLLPGNKLNHQNVADGESESFVYKPDTGGKNTFDMKIDKNAKTASDDVINDMYNAIGTIENGKLYLYGDILYYSIVGEDGAVTLKEVTVKDQARGTERSTTADTFYNLVKSGSRERLDYEANQKRRKEQDAETAKRKLKNFVEQSGFFPKW